MVSCSAVSVVDPVGAAVAHRADGDAAAVPGGAEERARGRAAAAGAGPRNLHHRVEGGRDRRPHRAHAIGIAVVEGVAQHRGAGGRGDARRVGGGGRRRHAVAHDREHPFADPRHLHRVLVAAVHGGHDR